MRFRWISIAVVLFQAVLVVPTAFATPLGKVTDSVGAALPSSPSVSSPQLPGTPPAPDPPPIPAPPAAPAPPGVSPPPVPVPTPPRSQPIQTPTVETPPRTPDPSRPASTTGPGSAGSAPDRVPAAVGAAGGREESADGIPGDSEGRASDGPGGRRLDSGAGSVDPAEVAPLGRLLAYVWPAFAVGSVTEFLAAFRAGVGEAVASSPVGALLGSPLDLAGESGAIGVAGVSRHSTTANPPPEDPDGIRIESGGELALFVLLAVAAALVAGFGFTLRHELRSMYR
jgi:hypothetical protein